MEGPTRDENGPEYLLPPCKVCGEPGTGFHYGVTTCGACKGFFRRSIIRIEPYRCTKNHLCNVGPSTNRRQICSRCRYEKCLAVGMSKDACKVGRYTLIKKTEDTEEAMRHYQTDKPSHPSVNTNDKANQKQHYILQNTAEIEYVSKSILDSSIIQKHNATTGNADGRLSAEVKSTMPNGEFWSNDGHFRITCKQDQSELSVIPSGKQPTVLSTCFPSTGGNKSVSQGDLSDCMITSQQISEIDNVYHSSYQYSPDSSKPDIDVDDHGILEEVSNSESPRRDSIACDNESYDTIEKCSTTTTITKKQCFQNTTRCDTKVLAPILKKTCYEGQPPFTLHVVSPDPIKYTLSIFEQFPFTSFEKESLAPLLKLCYDNNDWVDEYVRPPIADKNRVWNKMYKPHDQDSPVEYIVSSLVSPTHSEEMLTSVQGVTYDGVEMDKLLDTLLSAHSHHYGPESAFLCRSERRSFQGMFLKICQMHDSLKGRLNLIEDDRYFNILEETGIDVDKRKAWFNSTFKDMEFSFARDTNFLLAMPGFRELPLKDRITVTKAAFPYLLNWKHIQTTDVENDICIDEERGVAIRISTLQRVLPGTTEFFDEWVAIATALEDLKLSFAERTVLKTLFIMCPDFIEKLEHQKVITEWHNTYLKCLLHLLRKQHGPDADDRFKRVIDLLEALKKSCKKKLQKSGARIRNVIVSLSDGNQKSLIKEVIGSWEEHAIEA